MANTTVFDVLSDNFVSKGDVMFQQTKKSSNRISLQRLKLVSVFLWVCLVSPFSSALDLSQKPLFIGQSAKPIVMLAMSRDQELSYKAYPDYSNLDGGFLSAKDLTYRNDFNYYGYFNSKWCYSYAADTSDTKKSHFEPAYATVDHKCTDASGEWSGNFLNWATMTRMDIVRKVLFGGKRDVDNAKSGTTEAVTILERAFLPKDSHAFAKVYKGGDGAVSDYTPYFDSEITICNVSTAADGYPTIRVAKGVWNNWSHTEIQQCQWRSTAADKTNLDAKQTTSPTRADDKLAELVAKVKVCVAGKDVTGNIYNPSDTATASAGCFSYESGSYKPVGILQKKYDSINFGLVTGSWGKPGSGGVLRKKAGPIAGLTDSGSTDTVNEFSTSTGVFNTGVTGIIHNLSLFKIVKYSFADNKYGNNDDWRNPIGEIYAETLRYLMGKASPKFDANEITETSALTRVTTWNDPLPAESWCTNCSIIVLSSGPNSYDGDDLTDAYLKDINASFDRAALDNVIDSIAANEFGSQTNKFFVGQPFNTDGKTLNTDLSKQCSAVSVKLSTLRGRCPEYPTGQGTYAIAGLAYYARKNDMRPSLSGTQSISTYAVELSEGLPAFTIPVGSGNVSFVPVCTNNTHANACSLVGVRVENIVNDTAGNPISGRYLFYWEDQPWGSDYDMDAVQRIEFCVGAACSDSAVGSNQIKITNTLPYWNTGTPRMHMSYTIQGLADEADNKLRDDAWVTRTNPAKHGFVDSTGKAILSSLGRDDWYNAMDGADPLPANNVALNYIYKHTAIYNASSSSTLAASLTGLKTPLFYAAKYGKFDNSDGDGIPNQTKEWDQNNIRGESGADGLPDNYFVMKNPALLETGIINMIDSIVREGASGAGVATNSTRLDNGTVVYQALFNTDGWHGEIAAYKASATSSGSFTKLWTTRGQFTSESGRNILSYNPVDKKGIDFKVSAWSTLSTAQKAALGTKTADRQNVMKWVRGEDVTGYRTRIMSDGTTRNLLGDIVNSTPVFAGGASEGHEKLSATYGGTLYKDYIKDTKNTRLNVLYANSNDGMLHAINANCTITDKGDCGKEVFAYVPSMIYGKLPLVAASTYGKSTSHQYLVDGPISIGDAYITRHDDSTRRWRNILVGTMGAGARGIFVLDVTDPNSFDKSDVLFEITAASMPEIGNVFGRPYIAPIDGRWKIVLGNGYNSGDGLAYLLVIDLENPFDTGLTKKIATNTSVNNGLSAPTLYRETLADPIQFVYAGDRLGNMWKFNLKSGLGSAKPAFGSSPNFNPLFKAEKNSIVQPITAAPTLGFKDGKVVGGKDAVMVYFGTGSYLNDNDVTNVDIQSFYGIADELDSTSGVSGRSSLHQKTMTTSGPERTVNDNGTAPSKPDWRTHKGWYLDFDAGERVTNKAVLAYDRVIFSTLIPKTDGCSFGGAGWLMELVGVGDTSIAPLNASLLAKNGTKLENFIPGEITRLRNADTSTSSDTLVYSDIIGVLKAVPLKGGVPSDDTGRMSWRQLQ